MSQRVLGRRPVLLVTDLLLENALGAIERDVLVGCFGGPAGTSHPSGAFNYTFGSLATAAPQR